MALNLNTKKKLCKILSNGPIPELGNITGPVLYPTRIPMNRIVNMVQHGRKVIEVNPKDHNQTIQLTLTNVMKDNFITKDEYISKYINVPKQSTKEVIPPAKTPEPVVEVPKVDEPATPEVNEPEVTEEVVPVPSEEPEEEKKEETPENPIEDKIVFTPVTTTPEEEKDASDPVVNPDFNSRNANSYRNEYNGGGKKKHHRR